MEDAVLWARAQFALTAMYHWLFVPLTLGLGVIIAIMESIYYKTKEEKWKKITKFWMTLFGVNFAIGVATGLILEFQFGTNWSNYSWFVGDIFGAPLAIEGILAFFMESTFFAVMFFGWEKVSRGFHLASTWLTITGATISALWILVANAWMQHPVGMEFNPETVRNEMVSMASFWEVATSPIAMNKFIHTVMSSWVVGATFVVGVSAWFMLKSQSRDLARKSIAIAAPFGLLAILLTMQSGDGSAYQVAQHQPMKLAAMEGLYDGVCRQDLVAIGVLRRDNEVGVECKDPCLVSVDIPWALSFLAFRDFDAFVPGINDILKGGYTLPDGTIALSAEEKMARGRVAINALKEFKEAKAEGDEQRATLAHERIKANYDYFGYGYLDEEADIVPHVPIVFYSFHIMVLLGSALMLLFIVSWYLNHKDRMDRYRWILWGAVAAIPVAYIVSQAGWITAELGRQPWVIQDIMPTCVAISDVSAEAVQTTFVLFCLLFTTLLVAEIGIMVKQIKKGF